LLQQRDIYFGVVRCRIDAAVTQNQADLIEGNTMPQHLCGSRVSQQVGAFRW